MQIMHDLVVLKHGCQTCPLNQIIQTGKCEVYLVVGVCIPHKHIQESSVYEVLDLWHFKVMLPPPTNVLSFVPLF